MPTEHLKNSGVQQALIGLERLSTFDDIVTDPKGMGKPP